MKIVRTEMTVKSLVEQLPRLPLRVRSCRRRALRSILERPFCMKQLQRSIPLRISLRRSEPPATSTSSAATAPRRSQRTTQRRIALRCRPKGLMSTNTRALRMHAPTTADAKALKAVYRYLRDTTSYGITLAAPSPGHPTNRALLHPPLPLQNTARMMPPRRMPCVSRSWRRRLTSRYRIPARYLCSATLLIRYEPLTTAPTPDPPDG
ncbi:hypothetical protein BO85DRAFT_500670 [Aspergillus piperis CBS 112811]|uniref:Uncharacterized protein n=1 Tax=Aspergillus piperis CBS 112811 TaxID=1448313 RepID=A0A8G1QYN4_9EURO|nr:hypothetical protein BO85DRAFT_500670 [Aspergillus piperis CBS 112811]RAH54570.1 hypothetical protein BO85DRAFT_500670 [Aspergillus piperis CBS 112811]